MKNRKASLKIGTVVLSALMFVLSVMPVSALERASALEEIGYHVTDESVIRSLCGVTERQFMINNADGTNQIASYTLEFDGNAGSGVTFVAGYNDGDTDEWKMETVSKQAQAIEKTRGLTVVGAVNGAGFNTKTGEPSGLLLMNGKICHPYTGGPYLATLTDGRIVLRDTNDFSDVREAVSAMGGWIVKDGKDLTGDDATTHPRTAVGVKEDGTVVFLVADGRQKPYSCGMTMKELANALIALGCVDAVNMDGGASSTLISRRETDNDIAVRNKPSRLKERTVSTSLMICTQAKPTNVFDHVAFSDDAYRCNPSSMVRLKAGGVDVNGFAVDNMGKKGTMQVADASYGSLVGNYFRASGKEGTVTVNYVLDDQVVATTKIVITKDEPTLLLQLVRKVVQAVLSFFQLVEFWLFS